MSVFFGPAPTLFEPRWHNCDRSLHWDLRDLCLKSSGAFWGGYHCLQHTLREGKRRQGWIPSKPFPVRFFFHSRKHFARIVSANPAVVLFLCLLQMFLLRISGSRLAFGWTYHIHVSGYYLLYELSSSVHWHPFWGISVPFSWVHSFSFSISNVCVLSSSVSRLFTFRLKVSSFKTRHC